MEEYADAMTSAEPECLHNIWRRSNLHLYGGRMCSGHLQGRLLKMLVALTGARRVVELGTFTAYATVCLAEGLPEGGHVVTIEANDEMEDFIRQSLHEAGVGDKVQLVLGEAEDCLREMPPASVDLMFIDADKRCYCEYYALARRAVRPGGLIVADNTLWDGHVADPAYDGDPQTQGIRRFNAMVAEDPGVEQVLLPLRDGLTLIRIKEDAPQDCS